MVLYRYRYKNFNQYHNLARQKERCRMSHIAWDGHAPSDPRVPIQVHSPQQKEPSLVRLLGPWQGVWLHWLPAQLGQTRGRSLPHLKENCPHCLEGDRRPHWYGYAPAQLGRMKQVWDPSKRKDVRQYSSTWTTIVCPVTTFMATEVLSDGDPRGVVLQLTRCSNRREIRAEWLERIDTTDLPPAFDVQPILLRMWQISEAFLFKPQQQPPKQFLKIHEQNGEQPKRRAKKGGA